ncbi:MAG: 3-phosphoserine/phosphohydroxythreonine transaminase [Saprospiraceae bacterium]|jgi:phosphoserine aminotransferase|nr:3-phosphoserine/phosphohydroxythreonine transaminase [Saprospiraceae bacterium]
MKVHNFSAGPGILPQEVMQKAAEACINFNDTGLSLLEMSHRSKAFEAVMHEAESLVRELLQVSDDYAVLFLSGGASSQFFMVPLNLLAPDQKAVYSDTGVWANKSIKEAKRYGQIEVIASSKDANYTFIPKNFDIPADAKYFHITTNNTIYGTEYHQMPNSPIPLVADMSSNFMSRPVNVSDFDLIYAGAQKNVGPAGCTVVIVKKDILGKTGRDIPSMLDYRTHIPEISMYNTPPVFPIYVCMLTLRWIKSVGGLIPMEVRNIAKAKLLYDEIDRNPLFKGTTAVEDRSRMNVTFVTTREGIEGEFMTLAQSHGIDGIKGHRSVGGFRASIYNAMPQSSVQVLVDLMQEFEKSKG